MRPQDDCGNVFQGDVIAHDTKGSLVLSDKSLTALVGVRDLVVIATKDAILVADKSRSQDVKFIVDQLKATDRVERMEHTVIFRPWGSYEVLDRGENFLVNHIMVKPGQRMSLHIHNHRAEHWVVVAGSACVTSGEKKVVLQENQSIYIPQGERHQLENAGSVPLRLIEVQSGAYLGADDIKRIAT